METVGMAARLAVVLLGFVALYGLWKAQSLRRQDWTKKMFEIWIAQFFLVISILEANVELMTRGVFPSIGTFIALGVFPLVIKTTLFTNKPYLKSQEKKSEDQDL